VTDLSERLTRSESARAPPTTVARGCRCYKQAIRTACCTFDAQAAQPSALSTRALRKPREGGARGRCDRQGFGIGGVDSACASRILCKVRDKTSTLIGRQEEIAFIIR
jgi:hypothetical protein